MEAQESTYYLYTTSNVESDAIFLYKINSYSGYEGGELIIEKFLNAFRDDYIFKHSIFFHLWQPLRKKNDRVMASAVLCKIKEIHLINALRR